MSRMAVTFAVVFWTLCLFMTLAGSYIYLLPVVLVGLLLLGLAADKIEMWRYRKWWER